MVHHWVVLNESAELTLLLNRGGNSGASDSYRMTRAMAAVEEYLIRRGEMV